MVMACLIEQLKLYLRLNMKGEKIMNKNYIIDEITAELGDVKVTFTGTGKPKNSCDSFYCHI